jgi:hypothetical protein
VSISNAAQYGYKQWKTRVKRHSRKPTSKWGIWRGHREILIEEDYIRMLDNKSFRPKDLIAVSE